MKTWYFTVKYLGREQQVRMKDFLSVSSVLVSNKDNPVFILGRPWAFEELHLLA
jgi:hypothetical protein